MPFLFPSVSEPENPVEEDNETPPSLVKPRGRRKFNKHGEEVSVVVPSTMNAGSMYPFSISHPNLQK